jgi:phosphopantetheinyl transferase
MPPLRFERFATDTRAVVWRGTESREELLAALPDAWQGSLPTNHTRQLDTLSARRALLSLAPKAAAAGFVKDAYGKPHLKGDGALNFSLSHSHGHAAAVVSPYACGIDLQKRVDKITKLRHKFEREDERAFISQQPDEIGALHILWGAKESLFKMWGKREIDWHEHLIVLPFQHTPGGGRLLGEVRKDKVYMQANMWFRWVDDFCLVAAIASPHMTRE